MFAQRCLHSVQRHQRTFSDVSLTSSTSLCVPLKPWPAQQQHSCRISCKAAQPRRLPDEDSSKSSNSGVDTQGQSQQAPTPPQHAGQQQGHVQPQQTQQQSAPAAATSQQQVPPALPQQQQQQRPAQPAPQQKPRTSSTSSKKAPPRKQQQQQRPFFLFTWFQAAAAALRKMPSTLATFLLGGIWAAFLLYGWARGNPLKRSHPYRFTLMFKEASKVDAGTPVRMKGVQIGNVTSVTLHPAHVEAIAEVADASNIIPQGSRVDINLLGLAADPWIDITPPVNAVVRKDHGPHHPACAAEGLIVCHNGTIHGQLGGSTDFMMKVGRMELLLGGFESLGGGGVLESG